MVPFIDGRSSFTAARQHNPSCTKDIHSHFEKRGAQVDSRARCWRQDGMGRLNACAHSSTIILDRREAAAIRAEDAGRGPRPTWPYALTATALPPKACHPGKQK